MTVTCYRIKAGIHYTVFRQIFVWRSQYTSCWKSEPVCRFCANMSEYVHLGPFTVYTLSDSLYRPRITVNMNYLLKSTCSIRLDMTENRIQNFYVNLAGWVFYPVLLNSAFSSPAKFILLSFDSQLRDLTLHNFSQNKLNVWGNFIFLFHF